MVMLVGNFFVTEIKSSLTSVWRKGQPFILTGAIFIGAVKAILHYKKQCRRKKWNSVGKDVVVLHLFPRGRFCPNVSPFVVKLETYLRMAEIPYELDFEEPLGPKGKCPWITWNGKDLADSQLIIEALSKHYGKDFSSHLSAEDKALGLSMRLMVEEHFFWCNVMWRWVFDPSFAVSSLTDWGTWLPFHWFYRPVVGQLLYLEAYMQGIGRHTEIEVLAMGHQDLQALSVSLGDQPYFLGNKPTEIDCSIFGMMAQICWNSAGSPFLKMIETDYKNLLDYCHRMKEELWPDWKYCLQPVKNGEVLKISFRPPYCKT
ncbi:failed axon connections homolog isoform X1 [Macrobrachium nipponense]|uniref:failed axon connections homolog isoform X1 n=1 Tax=Macrobrachium nipponense TaxID=159736 RepID=UPI0030C8BB83